MTELSPHTRHALGVIEFNRALELVVAHTLSQIGAEKVRALRPRTDTEWIARELSRVEALQVMLRAGQSWSARNAPDVRAAAKRLAVPGTGLDGPELREMLVLLSEGRIARAQLASQATHSEVRAALADFEPRLFADVEIEKVIGAAIDGDGAVLDGASSTLKRIRRELADSRGRIITIIERIAASLPAHQRLPDVTVTLRDGRYVIPVRRDAKNTVGGIVHGTSASGATLFVEPPAVIEAGNRIRELESDELREIDRILRALTERLRPHAAAIAESLDAIAELDSLVARAIFAEEVGSSDVALVLPGQGFRIVDGRHPLLMAQRIAVVPFTLVMEPGEKTLVISGPNTGGKTVLLKSVALLSAMAQSGIPPSVGPGSALAVFTEIFADVGDEQSIEASLSTFSAHLRNISDILKHAGPESLVLMDETGSGTDPAEGAALAAAVLEELTRRGAITLATTHLGALQRLAVDNPAVVNSSLQFDSQRLEPTYRFVKGVPGRSYGLSIAKRLGLPADVMEQAVANLPKNERQLAALLASLEERERIAEEQAIALESRGARLENDEQALARDASKLKEQRTEFERESRRAARRHLLDAREEVEGIIADLRAAAQADSNEAARVARRRLEGLAAEHDSRLQELDSAAGESALVPTGELAAPGDFVSVKSLGGKEGQVIEVRGGSAQVAVGQVRLSVPLSGLVRIKAPARQKEHVPLRELPEEHPAGEIDLRGLRVDEVDHALIPALDAAARAGLPVFRIIHGKGTGALRSRVQEILSRDNRVSSFRDGAWNEGGTGATVVTLT